MSAPAERPHLRELRLDRGWTQQEVADRLSQLAWSRKEGLVGVNQDMVAKWERGKKNPSPRYRVLLAALYRVTPDQLGLPRAPREPAAYPGRTRTHSSRCWTPPRTCSTSSADPHRRCVRTCSPP